MRAMIRREGEALVLEGALNQSTIPPLWPLKPEWLAPPLERLELGALSAVDSAGLALLLELEGQARQQGSELRWQQCPAALERLMELYDLELVEARLQGT
ncbi:STAS domain-containing protein [Ferrimonas balearica]|nr:STAS domain-containing protein [Ferrimonas balearica]MBY5995447.1 STAS domain-containing protein [Ferrimonas balearica]